MHRGSQKESCRGGGARWGLLMVSMLLRLTLGEGWRPERLLCLCSGWLSQLHEVITPVQCQDSTSLAGQM